MHLKDSSRMADRSQRVTDPFMIWSVLGKCFLCKPSEWGVAQGWTGFATELVNYITIKIFWLLSFNVRTFPLLSS